MSHLKYFLVGFSAFVGAQAFSGYEEPQQYNSNPLTPPSTRRQSIKECISEYLNNNQECRNHSDSREEFAFCIKKARKTAKRVCKLQMKDPAQASGQDSDYDQTPPYNPSEFDRTAFERPSQQK